MMPFSDRSEIAALWRQRARLTRGDIFGPDDSLRPVYERRSALEAQIDIAATGMVGARYPSGGLAILSINPAGGNRTSPTDFRSDRMYARFGDLRDAVENDCAAEAFEDSNKAFIASMRHWGSMTGYLTQIQDTMKWNHEDIAYLYVVPFRTRGDNGSRMTQSRRGRGHIEQGYRKHLKGQLDLLSPGLIVAMDKPSYDIAARYRDEASPAMDVEYFPRKRDDHSGRKEALARLLGMRDRFSMIPSP